MMGRNNSRCRIKDHKGEVKNYERKIIRTAFRKFGVSPPIYDDLKSGEDYSKLKMTYHIGIIDFDVFPNNDELYSEHMILNTRTHELYTDKFCAKVLNLKHIDNPLGASPKIIRWAKIFKAKTLAELEKLAGQEEVFKKMVVELKKLSNDEKIKQQMEARADYESRIATARGAGKKEGMKEGIKEGIKEAQTQSISNLMKNAHKSFEEACFLLGINEAEMCDFKNMI